MIALSLISLGLVVWVFRSTTRISVLEARLARFEAHSSGPWIYGPLASRSGDAWEISVGGRWLNNLGVLVCVIGLAVIAGYSFALLLLGWIAGQTISTPWAGPVAVLVLAVSVWRYHRSTARRRVSPWRASVNRSESHFSARQVDAQHEMAQEFVTQDSSQFKTQ